MPLEDEIDMIFTIKNDEKQIIYHNFIIISLKNELSRVLFFDENFQINEENNEFNFLTEATLFCKRIKIFLGIEYKFFNFILQATKHTIRLLEMTGFNHFIIIIHTLYKGKSFIDLYNNKSDEILQICYFDNNIFIKSKNNSLIVYYQLKNY